MNLPVFARILFSMAATGLLASCSLVSSGPTVSPSATPAATAAATAESSPAIPPIPTTAAATSMAAATPTEPPPPKGILTVYGDAVEGWLGSYCWHSLCADAPAVPPKEQLPPVLGIGNEIEFSLSDGATFHTWLATYAADSDGSQTTLAQGGEGFDPDALPSAEPELLTAVTFDSPPGSDSVIFVQVFLEDGDLSYAWHDMLSRQPPTGLLRPPNGPSVRGYAGSWCYDGGCADGPSVGFTPEVRTQRGDELTFTFETGDEFAFARAQYRVARGDPPSWELGLIGTYVDPDTNATPGPAVTEFTFDAPPRGDWALDISVRFPGDLGDVPYNWHLIVE